MADLVVTVGKDRWQSWLAEGDCAGTRSTGRAYPYFLGPQKPPIMPGERLYIVAHGRLRGYAPVTSVKPHGRGWAAVRKGDAVAVTLPWAEHGFLGVRARWWERTMEGPFLDWKTAGVPNAVAQPEADADNPYAALLARLSAEARAALAKIAGGGVSATVSDKAGDPMRIDSGVRPGVFLKLTRMRLVERGTTGAVTSPMRVTELGAAVYAALQVQACPTERTGGGQ